MGKKEFATTVLDPEYEIFVIYLVSLNSTQFNVYPFYRLQIADLIAKETSIKIFAKYADFANIFFLDLESKLLEQTEINDHAIKIVNG